MYTGMPSSSITSREFFKEIEIAWIVYEGNTLCKVVFRLRKGAPPETITHHLTGLNTPTSRYIFPNFFKTMSRMSKS